MRLIDQISTVATTFSDARKLSVARVSTLVFGDGQKLSAILGGRADLTTSRFESAMRWFSEHWPDTADWPANVARPSPLHAEGAE